LRRNPSAEGHASASEIRPFHTVPTFRVSYRGQQEKTTTTHPTNNPRLDYESRYLHTSKPGPKPTPGVGYNAEEQRVQRQEHVPTGTFRSRETQSGGATQHCGQAAQQGLSSRHLLGGKTQSNVGTTTSTWLSFGIARARWNHESQMYISFAAACSMSMDPMARTIGGSVHPTPDSNDSAPRSATT